MIQLTWLGHSCFLLESDGYRIVTDPYSGVAGYPELHVQAHAVYCSHQHFDHDNTAAVEILPDRENPFTVRTVPVFHDEAFGALRGENTIHIFSDGETTVAHLGDLGHLLSKEQVRAIGPLDAALIPVGGVYTIGPADARTVYQQLNPRCMIPMHYRHESYGLPDIGEVDTFLEGFCFKDFHILSGNQVTLTDTQTGIIVPAYLPV